MDGFEILEGYEAVKSYLDDVQRVADDNRNALGFFPDVVYEQFALCTTGRSTSGWPRS